QHPLERAEAIGNALRVVEAIDAEDDPLAAEIERLSNRSYFRLPLGRLRRTRPQVRIDADREGLDDGGMTTTHDGEMLPIDAGFERALDGLEEVVAVELDVERQQVVAQQAV